MASGSFRPDTCLISNVGDSKNYVTCGYFTNMEEGENEEVNHNLGINTNLLLLNSYD